MLKSHANMIADFVLRNKLNRIAEIPITGRPGESERSDRDNDNRTATKNMKGSKRVREKSMPLTAEYAVPSEGEIPEVNNCQMCQGHERHDAQSPREATELEQGMAAEIGGTEGHILKWQRPGTGCQQVDDKWQQSDIQWQQPEHKLQKVDIQWQQPDTKITKNTLLLHSCCGPCSTACIERLIPDYKITVFFYNPNITDDEEYERRKAAQLQFLNSYNENLPEEDRVEFIEGEYLPEDFFRACGQYADEPEGGARCTECFRLRLEKTAQAALGTGNNLFGTTLTVSPHKNYSLVSEIGCSLANKYGLEFLDMDFKKKAGFQRSIQMSKEYGLYRQNYCGCSYSKYMED